MEPELLALGVLGAGLVLYALLGGADFGAGVWELYAAFRYEPGERALAQRAVGPVWEANHVWLVFGLVIAMGAFPVAFRAVSQALWLPLMLALAGIVFRGVGFVFRAYAAGEERQQTAWGAVFALSSTAAPFFFGACVGALASGELQVDAEGRFHGDFLTGWITPLGVFSAFFAVGVCAWLAAVYLVREALAADEPELLELWRRRALITGGVMGVLAVAGLGLLALEAPPRWRSVSAGWALEVGSALCGGGAVLALARRRYTAAVLLAAGAVVTVMLGWMLAQYPLLVPPAVTVEAAKAPDRVIWYALGAAGAGGVLLLPAMLYLFELFKWGPERARRARARS